MEENKEKSVVITCTLCPYGCRVQLSKSGGEYQATGQRCKRGREYALNELTHPTRTLTTTVKTVFKDFPCLPVKTSREIPLQDMFRCMEEINRITVDKRLKPGTVVRSGLLEGKVDLLATADMG